MKRKYAISIDKGEAFSMDAETSTEAAHAIYKRHKFGAISVETHFGDGGHRIETSDNHTIVVMPAQGGSVAQGGAS